MEQPPTFQVNGAAIRKSRMQAGLGTEQLATAAGISRRYLNHLENAYRKHMRPESFARLRTALGLEPDDTSLLDEAPEERR